MDPIEFIKQAKKLSERYLSIRCYENQVISEVVSDIIKNWIFGNSELLSPEIKFFSPTGDDPHYDLAGRYTAKLGRVLKELGIECEAYINNGVFSIIRTPKFK